jgi:hypothetical protein
VQELAVQVVVEILDVEHPEDANESDEQGRIDATEEHEDRLVRRRQEDPEWAVHPDRDQGEPHEPPKRGG